MVVRLGWTIDQMYCPGTGLGRTAIKRRSQMAEMAAGTGARDYI